MPTAVVVGAGIAGLASAALLAREGYQVTALEARATVGGRATAFTVDGFRFDLGPSWYLMPEVFEHFFALMGTSAQAELDLVRLDPAYRVYYQHGEPLSVRSGRADSLALFERVEPGAGRRLAAYLDSAQDTYTMAVRHFLYPTFASLRPLLVPDVLRRAPRLGRLLGQSLWAKIEATVTDTRLRQILGYPAVFLGSAPRLTPSMYHLMSHLDLVDGVLYPQGGFGELIAAVQRVGERAGVQVRTDADVTAITTAPAGRRRGRATGVRYRTADGAEHTLTADLVVSTADLHHTEHQLLPARLRSRSARWWRRQVPGPSTVMVYLGVRGELPELAHHSLFFAEEWDATFEQIFAPPAPGGPEPMPDPTSVYLSRVTATDPTAAPAGMENLVVLVPVPPDVRAGHGGPDGTGDPWVEQVADRAIAQVAAWAGVPDLAERIVVRRTVGPADWADDLRAWRGTALGPAHTLRQSALFRAGNTARRVDGLLYAGGSVIPGIGLPMCLISAELVVKRLRGDVSTGPLPVAAGGGAAGGGGASAGPGARVRDEVG